MTFSVIIPTYNRADLLERCLESLSVQTYTNFEVLVCDDGSTDNSKEVAERYADRLSLTYIWNENWGGPARPRNIGIQAAKGEWICFLDSDDWWAPNKLEACLPYLGGYDMLYHDMFIFDQEQGAQQQEFIRCRTPQLPIYEELLRLGNCCPNSSVVLRRSVVDEVGLLSEDRSLVAVEDFDYWLRVSRVTDRFFHIQQKLGYYWVGDSSISACDKWFARHEALYTKHLPNVQIEKTRHQIALWQHYRAGLEYEKYDNVLLARKHYKKALGITRLRSKLKLVYLLIKSISIAPKKCQ